MRKIKISDDAFAFLYLQRGGCSHITDRGEFERAYEIELATQFESIRPCLPQKLNCLTLDIGGGMGSIHAHLRDDYDHYHAHIVDGIDSPREVIRHNAPFNNAMVATDFLAENGVNSVSFTSPEIDFAETYGDFDLVISFAAYCFHLSLIHI